MNDLAAKFEEYHQNNPQIYRAFCRFAFQAIDAGRTKMGAKMIAERIRWDTFIRGDDDYKMNNNYPAFYARMFMRRHPEHAGIFRTRASVADNPIASQTG